MTNTSPPPPLIHFLIALSAVFCTSFGVTSNVIADSQQAPQDLNKINSIPGQTPDLKWQPLPFLRTIGSVVRYINYRDGKDSNPGTMASPWKHHPWDQNATSLAAEGSKIDTYIFKKGVVYRGSLTAKESGTTANPILLTIDPSWGTGNALISGSRTIKEGWIHCNTEESKQLPSKSRSNSWCTSFHSANAPHLLWERHGSRTIRIPLARYPNWNISNPDDPRSEWLELDDVILEVQLSLIDSSNFTVGDTVKPVVEAINPHSIHRVIGVGKDHILVEVHNWKKSGLKKGTYITNGQVKARITDIWGTHNIKRRLIDPEILSDPTLGSLDGAVVWSEGSNIPKVYPAIVTAHNQQEGSITANFHLTGSAGPARYTRYYIEGLPQFLDADGEYYYKKQTDGSWRIFLRLPDKRNPNDSVIEIAANTSILKLNDKSNIEVSGLHFGFSNQINIGSWDALYAPVHASAIQIRGSSSNINIHHCNFHDLPAGIIALPSETGSTDILDEIRVADSEFHNIDGSAIALSNGRSHAKIKKSGSRLLHTRILRNKMENTGYRTLGHWAVGSLGHGIEVTGSEISEIAYNHINRVWGSGISVYLGTDYQTGKVLRPFLRGLIHHNKVTNSILGLQDYGGIASWNGGPLYIYNNISGNPVGYKHEHDRLYKKKDWHRRSSFGLGIYLDGQYKGYVFNNIVWGENNDVNSHIYNAGAIKEAMGFMNTVFHNTLYNFGVGLDKDMPQHNRNYYIGNLMLDMDNKFIHHLIRPELIEYRTLAFTRNLFSGSPSVFGLLGNTGGKFTYNTLSSWIQGMKKHSMFKPDTGTYTTQAQILNNKTLDFRLKPDSAAINNGARVFVPWALYGVVGEWNFFGNRGAPERIPGENLNMDQQWMKRSMFQTIPRNDLVCKNITFASYRDGVLEDWVAGALSFNGKNQYCESQYSRYENNSVTDIKQTNLDIDNSTSKNLLIETVLLPNTGHTTGTVVSKLGESSYELSIDSLGHARLTIHQADKALYLASESPINDGKWHHVIAEFNPSPPNEINIYIDGVLSNGDRSREDIIIEPDFSNTSQLQVGRSGDKFFSGKIDFLRIATGSLEDAETNIEELYDWQFNGPFLRDFTGKGPIGTRRDIGAVEYVNN